jgi:hypothetical protein
VGSCTSGSGLVGSCTSGSGLVCDWWGSLWEASKENAVCSVTGVSTAKGIDDSVDVSTLVGVSTSTAIGSVFKLVGSQLKRTGSLRKSANVATFGSIHHDGIVTCVAVPTLIAVSTVSAHDLDICVAAFTMAFTNLYASLVCRRAELVGLEALALSLALMHPLLLRLALSFVLQHPCVSSGIGGKKLQESPCAKRSASMCVAGFGGMSTTSSFSIQGLIPKVLLMFQIMDTKPFAYRVSM